MWWWWWWRGWCGRAVQELTQRTGRNPQYSYLSIGCSKAAEERMLAYARTLVGRPFSNAGMVRSIIYPRQTDEKSFFCAGARLSPFCLHFVSIQQTRCAPALTRQREWRAQNSWPPFSESAAS